VPEPPLVNAVGDLVLTDPGAMRALANPLRLGLLDHLRREGPASAAQLSSDLDASRSTVQESLHELEHFGLVTHADETGWGAVAKGFVFEIPDDLEGQAAARELSNAMLLRYVDLPRQWIADHEPQLDLAWIQATGLTNARVVVTPDELRGLQEGLEGLLEPFIARESSEAPAGAGPARVLSYFMPEGAPDSARIVQANGVDLCVETFGDRADPPILLIAGAAGSMLSWPEELCERLATGRRFVIRYDFRDTGRSVTYEPGAPQYTFGDLVADAVGLPEALGVRGAHFVGLSMGGAIAQIAALDHPGRVASLTLISTSPAGPGAPDLPPMSQELRAYFAQESASPDWSDRSAVIDYYVRSARPHAARSQPFDEAEWRELGGRDFDRSIDLASSMTNHFVIEDGGEWRERLGEIRVPTLVIHGTEDPLFPLEHGLALAKEIPGARLLELEQTGHELPRRVWDVVVPAILEHTAERA
jgi:pimeloyl-ACP methyl ester carboxylesterase/DNA-binding transcriptional ArsR family regulator